MVVGFKPQIVVSDCQILKEKLANKNWEFLLFNRQPFLPFGELKDLTKDPLLSACSTIQTGFLRCLAEKTTLSTGESFCTSLATKHRRSISPRRDVKELSLCHKLKFSNHFIFETWLCLYFDISNFDYLINK